MKELDAINSMLRLIGSSPVNSIDTKHPDVVDAKAALEQSSAQLQSSRWWFNTDYSVEFVREQDNRIRVPTFVTEVTTSDRDFIIRGDYMYDKRANTYQFDTNLICDTLSSFEWDMLPIKAKYAILYIASSDFVRDSLGDTNKIGGLSQKISVAMMELNKDNISLSQAHILDRRRVLRARAGVRPYYRGGVRFHGDV